MDIIIFANDSYHLVPVDYEFDWTLMSVFEYCDAFREAMSTFDNNLNRWVMNDRSGVFFGCVGN